MKRVRWAAAAALFALGSLQTSSAYELTGRIVSIADGDTVTLLDASLQQHKIRLSGIDAPEKRQPFGQIALNGADAYVEFIGKCLWHQLFAIVELAQDGCQAQGQGVVFFGVWLGHGIGCDEQRGDQGG